MSECVLAVLSHVIMLQDLYDIYCGFTLMNFQAQGSWNWVIFLKHTDGIIIHFFLQKRLGKFMLAISGQC